MKGLNTDQKFKKIDCSCISYHPKPLVTVEYLSIKAVNLSNESFLRTANWPADKFDIFKEL